MSKGTRNPFDEPTRFRAVPRPGLGKGGAAAEPPPPAPPAREPPSVQVQPSFTPGAVSRAEWGEFSTYGPNRIVGIAMPLFALIGRLRTTVAMPNVAQVRQQVLRTVRAFEEKLATLGYPPDIQMPAHYVLCTAIDQAVLNTPWGTQSEWASQGMLVTFHREVWGGKKFFEILERVFADPHRYIDLLEVQYLCLVLGFTGKYQEDPQGPARLLELRDDAYRRIRDVRGTPSQALSVKWEGERDKRPRITRYLPLWVAAAAAAIVVFLVFLACRALLYSNTRTIDERLVRVGTSAPVYTTPAEPVRPVAITLKEQLGPEERAGEVTIEETDSGTLVSLISNDLFASGSASVNPVRAAALRRVGEKLDAVTGRVLITGHTDDQPIRSFRFNDNVELSRARAASVKSILAEVIREPGRLATRGLGSTAPRYLPANDPDNRARNRRVEILLEPQ